MTTKNRKRSLPAFVALIGVLLMSSGFAIMATAGSASADNHQITICHATAAEGNPYTSNNIPKKQISDDGGHRTGQESVHPGDIIPPFPAGEASPGQSWDAFGGANWDAEGQAIYNGGKCDGGDPEPEPCPGGDFNGPAEGCGTPPNPCPDGDFNGGEPGCGTPPNPCPGGDFNGPAEGCGTPPNPCPDGDFNGPVEGCGTPPNPCPDGDFNGEEPGCGTPPVVCESPLELVDGVCTEVAGPPAPGGNPPAAAPPVNNPPAKSPTKTTTTSETVAGPTAGTSTPSSQVAGPTIPSTVKAGLGEDVAELAATRTSQGLALVGAGALVMLAGGLGMVRRRGVVARI